MTQYTRTQSPTPKARGPYQLGASLEDVFFARFERKEFDQCWEWHGYTNAKGYGKLTHRGRTYRAHRLAWQFHHGVEPSPDMAVCHTCDNPRCVNPYHLWIDTQAENMQDKKRKGRQHRGESHPRTHLTANKVRRIRALRRKGLSHKEIAIAVECSKSSVGHVLRGNSWQHIT